jgi:2-C-methyl-D-erythritol 4-phosphate cytidylyltransferase
MVVDTITKEKLLISAVIVAAGKGSRMNMDTNKQYIDICGKPVIARTLQVFEDCRRINEIVLVVNQQDLEFCRTNIIDKYRFRKVKIIVPGGQKRQDSVCNGLLKVDKSCSIVLIHDGARPFITEGCINLSIEAAFQFGASCVAVPSKDTIKKADSNGFAIETPDRSSLWLIQTPQAFKYGLILEAHKRAVDDGFEGTDDAVLVERLGAPLKLVMGSYDNIKITTQEDIVLAEAIAGSRGL